ncbi:methylated-DNA--[protein]-cysteine S-methyltransferase [Paenibacillus albicereus]|uniref:methylated-DNA--[protein]-cysteine S-methyltransferase n=1 Tax=Paenibacillus albicereus TaxID=2726185 RepID=A0A6H2GZ88_9BACL|nr:methylated-DNA--[protein]-cysteine S-methyltransferase [Paenibacillus albicereus]QJC52707.1 methylated-DNA--[protein]-cysteine S-methyltransferase [Paenibacillus albicereus]
MSAEENVLYWSVLEMDGWRLHAAADSEGFAFCGSQDAPFEELAEWAGARRPGSRLERSDAVLQPYLDELAALLSGKSREFRLPLSLGGTAFQREVWDELRRIPYGETRTYLQIAEAIGRPSAARAVGAAIGANPVLMPVPCHRVVGSGGALTGYRGGLEMKRRLLALEGSAGRQPVPERRS